MTPAPVRVVALVGMPGGGKSTIGRHLAKRLGWRFFDSDAVIEKEQGRAIRSIFETDGEAFFRDIEESTIARLLADPPLVLATGGGAVLREATRRSLKARAWTLYLHSTPDELFRRLRHDTQRPLLQVDKPLVKLQELYGARDALYREVADHVIETGRPTIPALVNAVMMQLELGGSQLR